MPLTEIPLSAWRKRSQTFVFRGQPIRYWTAGQGEPLLLIDCGQEALDAFARLDVGVALDVDPQGEQHHARQRDVHVDDQRVLLL